MQLGPPRPHATQDSALTISLVNVGTDGTSVHSTQTLPAAPQTKTKISGPTALWGGQSSPPPHSQPCLLYACVGPGQTPARNLQTTEAGKHTRPDRDNHSTDHVKQAVDIDM
jgi:hypothetical protein